MSPTKYRTNLAGLTRASHSTDVRTTTNVRLRNTFVFTPSTGSTRFHLPESAFAAWVEEDAPPKCTVWTRCRRRLGWFTTSMTPPDGFEMCDDCALADWIRPSVYRWFGDEDRPLYIGFSVDPLLRFKQHSRDKHSQRWWSLRRSVTITPYATEAEGRAAEIEAIAAEKPIYNRHRVPRREWVMAS
jgi:predicted GIY-YIG superfamily endonuclease